MVIDLNAKSLKIKLIPESLIKGGAIDMIPINITNQSKTQPEITEQEKDELNNKLGYISRFIKDYKDFNSINTLNINKGFIKQFKDFIDNNTDEKQNEQVKHLDSAIDANRIKTRVHTYSGVSFDPTKHMDENGHLHSPAYISTSHDKETASRFSVPKDGIHHIIHLHIDANGPAMHVPEHVSGLSEDEILLKRGTTLQHHGYTDYTHPHRTYRVHRMTVVNKE